MRAKERNHGRASREGRDRHRASKGIGAAVAHTFTEAGAAVAVNYTSNKGDAGGWDASAGVFPAMTGDVPFLMKLCCWPYPSIC